MITALAHVIVTEGLVKQDRTWPSAATRSRFAQWSEFVARAENSPEATESVTGVPAARGAGSRPALCQRPQRRHLLRPRRDGTQPGLDDGDGHRQPRDGDRQRRPRRRRREPACAARTTCRAPATWARFRTSCPATGMCPTASPAPLSKAAWGVTISPEPGPAHSRTCSRRRSAAASRASTAKAKTSSSPTRTRSTWRRP